MKYLFDLQLHSNLSDGVHSIKQVVKMAKGAGLKAISITDHNTYIGFEEKNQAANNVSIENIAGIEISCTLFSTDVHILGYAKKFNVSVLKEGLQKTIKGYNQRAFLMIKKLQKEGIINIDFKIIKKNKGRCLAIMKFDIAKVIAPLLHLKARQALKLVDKGGVAYIPYGNWAMTPMEVIKLIHRANGIAVLSHPGEIYENLIKKYKIKEGSEKFKQLLERLIAYKLDGIEIYSPKNSWAIKNQCLKTAKQHNLIITGGSDWHGKEHHPELKLGNGGLNQNNFKKFLIRLN